MQRSHLRSLLVFVVSPAVLLSTLRAQKVDGIADVLSRFQPGTTAKQWLSTHPYDVFPALPQTANMPKADLVPTAHRCAQVVGHFRSQGLDFIRYAYFFTTSRTAATTAGRRHTSRPDQRMRPGRDPD
jgi:hypothetical protein